MKRIRLLDVLLAIIAVVSVAVVLLFHEDQAFYKVFYDLGVGALVTLAFYFLVVRWPDYQRRQRLKRSLELYYRAFRLNCIEIMLIVADGELGSVEPEALLDPEKFREYFKQKVTPDKERWHEFMNNLTEYYLGQLQTLMGQFRDELIFILNNVDITKDEPFEYLKRLSAAISQMKTVTIGYDEIKPLAGFLWDVFAGWDWVKGYRKEDIIQKMIDEI